MTTKDKTTFADARELYLSEGGAVYELDKKNLIYFAETNRIATKNGADIRIFEPTIGLVELFATEHEANLDALNFWRDLHLQLLREVKNAEGMVARFEQKTSGYLKPSSTRKPEIVGSVRI